jgi:hypothetical protein
MAVYTPDVRLTLAEKELLSLLASLILEAAAEGGSNSTRSAPLSDREAARLLELLEGFVHSKKFQEGGYFVENLTAGGGRDLKNLREIYLSWRSRHGRSRAVSTVQWENFLARLGIGDESRPQNPVWYQASATPMTFDHFMKMERKLATSAELHPRVRVLILSYVLSRRKAVEAARSGKRPLESRQVRNVPESLLSDMKRDLSDPIGSRPIPVQRLSAVLTIVMDFSALFTTRDWDVAGTLSAVAGAFPFLAGET